MKKMKTLALLATVISLAGLLALGLPACKPEPDPDPGPEQPVTPTTEFTVTFDPNGGTINGSTAMVTIKVAAGATIGSKLPTPPVKTSAPNFFGGWYLTSDTNQTGTVYTDQSVITANTALKAKWTATQTVVVTFNPSGGKINNSTENTTLSVTTGTPIGANIPTPVRQGYVFDGWYLSTDTNFAGQLYTGTNPNISGNITLIAKWTVTDPWHVTFDPDNSEQTFVRDTAKGQPLGVLPTPPTKYGYLFGGWYLSTDTTFTGTQYTATEPNITEDTFLKAKWNDNFWTVSFDLDGGTVNGSGTINPVIVDKTANTLDEKLPSTPVKTDWRFLGWYESTDSVYATKYSAATAITKDLTLKARWTDKSNDASIRDAGISQTAPEATQTAGLYIGGVPATSNGTPGTGMDVNTYTSTGNITANGEIKTNKVSGSLGNSIVVITKDKVSKVEIAIAAAGGSSVDNNSAPGAFAALAKENGSETPTHLQDKRWTTTVTEDYPTSGTTVKALYVRITAADEETVNVYRYSWTRTNSDRGLVTSLTIGTVTLTANTTTGVFSGNTTTAGNVRGWHNNTASPGFAYSTVTIPGTPNASINVPVSINVTNSSHGGTVKFTRLSVGTTWPFNEKPDYTYEDTVDAIPSGGDTSPGPYSATVNNVSDGDYILVRYWSVGGTSNTAQGQGYFAAACVKVVIQDSAPTPVFAPNGNLSTTSKSYQQGDTADALTVTISSPSTGLTYDWHQATGASGDTGASQVSPANATNTFTPPTDTIRTVYYFVKVTASETGKPSATIDSARAPIVVTARDASLASGSIAIDSGAADTALPTAAATWAVATAKDKNVDATPTSVTLAGTTAANKLGMTVEYGISANGTTEPVWQSNGTFTTGLSDDFYAGIKVTSAGTVDSTPVTDVKYYKWHVLHAVVRNNANIRAVFNAREPNATYGMYIGGMPALENGTPGTGGDLAATNAATAGAVMAGTNVTAVSGKHIVVITEYPNANSVTYAVTGDSDPTAALSWLTMNQTDDGDSGTAGKRWIAELGATPAYPTSSGARRVYVKIVSEDGTATKIYRFQQYCAASTTTHRATLTAVTFNGVDGLSTVGTVAGWWNATVAPDLAPGTVKLPSVGTVSVVATIKNTGITGVTSCLRIPASLNKTWPFKEDDYASLPFSTIVNGASTAAGSGEGTAVTISVPNVEYDDYILIRYLPGADAVANYRGTYAHYLIKVIRPD